MAHLCSECSVKGLHGGRKRVKTPSSVRRTRQITAVTTCPPSSLLQGRVIKRQVQPQDNPSGQPHVTHRCSHRCTGCYIATLWCLVLIPSLPFLSCSPAVGSYGRRNLKRSPFKALSRSVYSRTCYAYCQGLLPWLFVPFRFIHLHFFPKPLPVFFCVGCG